ncbi:COG1361 S-layer family protein [Paenibacillus glufosinatiresistens]|uniref:COG1361 S-layer family protein n=1 Tax=Paenibacillus glufosinatiresistens TaxID=3070657 RepID=UPI00286D7699|nr:CARDB domain-containing protein [Paenibacillus sp. YX.27]
MKFKLTAAALILVMLAALFPAGRQTAQAETASPGPVYDLTGYKIYKGNTAQINPADEVTLRLSVNQKGGAPKELSLQIDDSSSFYGKEGNVLDLNKAGVDYSGASFTVDLPVVYSGSGQKLTVSFLPDGGSPETQSLTITQAVPVKPAATPTPTPVDTTKFVPKLAVAGGGDVPSGEAGGMLTLALPIKNGSSNAARSVTVTLEPGDAAKIPFEAGVVNLSQTIDQINPGETRAAAFNLKLRSDAAAGVYALKLNYAFTNAAGDPFTSSEGLYIKVTNSSVPARISLVSVSQTPAEAVPGQKVKLAVRIANDGTVPSGNVRVTLTGLKADGFALSGDTGSRRIASIAGGGTQEAVFSLTAAAGLAGGSQPLGVRLDYKDESGAAVSDESPIFIPVRQTEGAAPAAVVIDKLISPESVMLPGDRFNVGFRLVNSGGVKAQNVKVSVTSDKELIPVTLSNVIVPSLAPGASKALSFKLAVAPDAATRNYPVSIAVEYDVVQAGQTVKNTLQQYVGVYVQGKGAVTASPEALKTVPRIIVSRYAVQPAQVAAGKEAAVELALLNTSSLMGVSNIKLTVTSDDGTFTIDGSNTLFIESLPSRGTVQRALKVRAKPDAEPKVYSLTLNLDYEDAKGNPYTSKETVSLPVVQENRLNAGEVAVGGEAYPGQPVPLSMEFYNMGKAVLYNLMVTVEGEGFQSANGSYYVGNFASGRSDTFQPTITANAPGELKGEVVFAFEDAAGTRSEIRKPFKVTVMEAPPAPDMSGAQPEQPLEAGGKSALRKYLPYGLAALAVLAGAVTALVLRRRRRRRKEMELDDDF